MLVPQARVIGNPGLASPSVVPGHGDPHRYTRPLRASHTCGYPGPQESLDPTLALGCRAAESHDRALL